MTTDDKIVHLLDDLLIDDYAKTSESTEPGAAVLVVIDDRIVYRRCFGLANAASCEDITCDTNFRLASLTKQFTAYGIVRLEQEGKLSCQDTLGHFFPLEFREKCPMLSSRIIVQHLLDHSSGLFDFENDDKSYHDGQWSDYDVLAIFPDETYFEPGSQFRYSNTGYILLGLIIEIVSGQSLQSFFQKFIFEPCNMKSSILYDSPDVSIANRALGYVKKEKEQHYTISDQSSTSATRGDGGIYMSINDYLRWYQYYHLTKASMFPIDDTKSSFSEYYSLGWFLSDASGQIRIHSGYSCGFTHQVFRIDDEQRKILVLYLSNIGDNNVPIEKFNRLIVEQIPRLNPNNTDLLWKMIDLTR